MTSISVNAAAPWVLADLDADPLEWARETVRHQAPDLPEQRVHLLADVLVPALQAARSADDAPLMLLFLIPEAGQPSVCSVSVRVEGVDAASTLESLLEGLRLPQEMLERSPLEEVIQTSSGAATHLVQRYRTPANPEFEMVQEHEAFVWLVSTVQGDLAVYLSTSYLDLAEAGRYRPHLVDLASSLTVA